jgi:DNA primase
MEMNKPDILLTIEQAGFAPNRKGKSFWLSCPFHEEKTPSLKINPDKQTYYCFGCRSHGSVIDFIMELHGLSFKDACKYLNLQKPLKVNSETQKKKALVNDFREWEKSLRKELTDFYREFKSITRNLQTWGEVEAFEEDFDLMPIVEWYLEILTNGTDEEKYILFKEVN